VANLIDDPEEQSSFIKKAIPAARYGLKTIGKAGVAWILKQNADDIADEYEEIIKKAGDDSINAAAGRLIKDHQDALKNLETLREALIQVAAEASIIIFINELDRCKPDFSVAIMENIKHVFDVDNVQFVLVANFEQLKDSINHCYGLGVDAQRYLDKFIKYSFKLSPLYTTDQHNFTLAAVAHAKNLILGHKAFAESALTSNGCQDLIKY
jgi:predicted KAP-like P-loop ATPase